MVRGLMFHALEITPCPSPEFAVTMDFFLTFHQFNPGNLSFKYLMLQNASHTQEDLGLKIRWMVQTSFVHIEQGMLTFWLSQEEPNSTEVYTEDSCVWTVCSVSMT